MNILIMVSSLNYGGAEKQAVLDANMLTRHHTVYMGAFESGDLANLLHPDIKQTYFRKTNYVHTAYTLSLFVRKHHIEVVHCHLYAPMIIAALASTYVRVPVIWHFHGHHFEVNKQVPGLLSNLPTVKRLIFVCAQLAEYFEREFSFPKEKFEIIYNSTQCKKLPRTEPKTGKIVIGFTGRLVELKRVEFLIDLAGFLKNQQIKEFEIQILGDGPERLKLETYAAKKAVTDIVHFLGFQADINTFYNQFDLFILPSREEAFSLALIDAGITGIPAIAFDVGGNKEIIVDGTTGYIVHTQAEMMEKALHLCHNTDLRKIMGQMAEKQTCKFTEEIHLQKLLRLYKQFAPKNYEETPEEAYESLAKSTIK